MAAGRKSWRRHRCRDRSILSGGVVLFIRVLFLSMVLMTSSTIHTSAAPSEWMRLNVLAYASKSNYIVEEKGIVKSLSI